MGKINAIKKTYSPKRIAKVVKHQGGVKQVAMNVHSDFVKKGAGTKATAYANVAQVGGAGIAGAAVARDRYKQRVEKKGAQFSQTGNPGSMYVKKKNA